RSRKSVRPERARETIRQPRANRHRRPCAIPRAATAPDSCTSTLRAPSSASQAAQIAAPPAPGDPFAPRPSSRCRDLLLDPLVAFLLERFGELLAARFHD